jgi:hypothetical protein
MFKRFVITLALTLPAAEASHARPQACLTSLEGFPVPLAYDTTDPQLKQNRTIRERLFGAPGAVTCPGYVTLRALTPGLSDTERTVFCLQFDQHAKTYTGFAEGQRDAYLSCAVPSSGFCEKVNTTAEIAMSIAAVGATTAGNAARDSVAKAAGAVILTGSTASVSATLSSLGASAMSVLSAPAALTAAAVTVVAVGGAVYVCSEQGA